MENNSLLKELWKKYRWPEICEGETTEKIDLRDVTNFLSHKKFTETFLVIDVQPLEYFQKENEGFSFLDNSRDSDIGILLETQEGFKILGLMKYKQYRLLKEKPITGKRFKFTGLFESIRNDLKQELSFTVRIFSFQ